MKKSQIFHEFFILGAVLFILLLLILYKLGAERVSCYIQLEYNLKKSTIMSQYIPAPMTFKDKLLITTEYFSYYIPANIWDLAEHHGRIHAQKEILSSVTQIESQIKAHNIKYNKKSYNRFKNSINNYINCINDSQLLKSERRLDRDFTSFKKSLKSNNNTVSAEGIILIENLVGQIKELNNHNQ
ncbi:MAG: hypothetical protein A2287_03915 [Candidatus Melainabacteria bacterium RIFOXYA12_FULL_32_12]|nr:MAG: hypothetical protein A2255_04750 [Candidatus Melainabacteria bacterium RIFOXYA2_FULL_32_9]OGI24351.1 MAG: hypothetical protein A2287_03915 [Candidatus Melainabacteria bacterium RIFOXYA12_FULL_32_12]